MRAKVVVECGECEPKSLVLNPEKVVTIGRSRDCDFVIKDELVSRLHLKLIYEDGNWAIRDFSLNGSKVGADRIAGAAVLDHGAKFIVGPVTFRFDMVETSQLSAEAAERASRNDRSSQRVGMEDAQRSASRSFAHSTDRIATQAIPTAKVSRETLVPSGTVYDHLPDHTQTQLQHDELTALCKFMTSAIAQSDSQEIIKQALRAILNQTSSTLVGYLSLDINEPVAKLVMPERVSVDTGLSRRLTERVRETNKRVWLFADMVKDVNKSGSLSSFTDAICYPIGNTQGEAVAALHAYRSGRNFTERDVKFIEAVANYLTPVFELHRQRRKLQADNLRLRTASTSNDELIGDSNAMMNLRMQIGRSATLPFTVLIHGENGTGKEMVALALHENSSRAHCPLIVVNCASIAKNLLEAELFGYRKSAFPGADADRIGLVEQADEGTLYIDEITDLSLECQAKLLDVIEGKAFRPIGSTREVRVETRVIAGTTKDLDVEVQEGRFSRELLFRVRVIAIKVPPLREHAEDIAELSRYILEKLSQQLRRHIRLSQEAQYRLFAYQWPGNVRQLRAVLEAAAVMCENGTIEADALPIPAPSDEAPMPGSTSSLNEVPSSMDMDDLETWAILRALKHTSGNVSQAARVLGISRDTLHTKLKKKNIDREQLTAAPEAANS